jgi:uncharacterized protein involved in oxidation of intracellular sulfur
MLQRTAHGIGSGETGGVELKLFLFGDAVGCAKSGQKLPSGHYNAEVIIGNLKRAGVEIGA